jgi:hypothetical protein
MSAQAFRRRDRNPVLPSAVEASGLTDRVIVKYKDSSTNTQPNATSLAGAHLSGGWFDLGISHHRRMASGADVLKLDRRMTGDQVKRLLADMKGADSNIEYLEPDRIPHAMGTPNDPMYNQQWSLFDSTVGVIASVPTIVNGTIKATSDTDYFKVTAKSNVVATLAPYDIYVYDASGNLFDCSINGTGQTDEVIVSNTSGAAATTYIRVVRNSGQTGTAGTYTLSVSH